MAYESRIRITYIICISTKHSIAYRNQQMVYFHLHFFLVVWYHWYVVFLVVWCHWYVVFLVVWYLWFVVFSVVWYHWCVVFSVVWYHWCVVFLVVWYLWFVAWSRDWWCDVRSVRLFHERAAPRGKNTYFTWW